MKPGFLIGGVLLGAYGLFRLLVHYAPEKPVNPPIPVEAYESILIENAELEFKPDSQTENLSLALSDLVAKEVASKRQFQSVFRNHYYPGKMPENHPFSIPGLYFVKDQTFPPIMRVRIKAQSYSTTPKPSLKVWVVFAFINPDNVMLNRNKEFIVSGKNTTLICEEIARQISQWIIENLELLTSRIPIKP